MQDAHMRRFVVAHLVTVIGEWAAVVGILVHAYDWGGSTTVGIVSLAVLAPALLVAPVAAGLLARTGAHTVRLAGFATQAIAYAGATVAAALDAPTPVVAAGVVIGVGAANTLRPTGAVIMPAIARSARDLTTGNLTVSHCDSASGLIGPLLAAGLAGIGDASIVFGACTASAVVALAVTAWRPAALANVLSPSADGRMRRRVVRTVARELRTRPWAIGVAGASAARNLVVGALDVLLVIVALQMLGLGDGGPGLLTALVGVGALVSTAVTTVVVRRAVLSPTLVLTLVATAAACVVLGVWTIGAVVFVTLPVIGVCLSSMDNISRILLQRSTDPRSLGPLFAGLGAVAGVGQLVGSALAQVVIAISGPEAALIGVGAVLVVSAVAVAPALRDADHHADVPVVEMTLLGSLPMFAPLPAAGLESVARATRQVTIAAGDDVVVQGQPGDTFYAVAEGEFDVVMSGELVRTARRGDFFGEVALLADVPRTATVTARRSGELLSIERGPFLLAITGHDVARSTARDHVRSLRLDPAVDVVATDRPPPIDDDDG